MLKKKVFQGKRKKLKVKQLVNNTFILINKYQVLLRRNEMYLFIYSKPCVSHILSHTIFVTEVTVYQVIYVNNMPF